MSSFPVNPRGTRPRRSGGSLLVLLFFLCIGVYFLYNMMPNLFSAVLPNKGGPGGEWVGLVKYKKGMMSNMEQPAAVKLTMTSSHLTSVIPSYKMVGELRVAGHTTPITFEADQVICSRDMPSLGGFMDKASDPGLEKASIDGNVKDGRLTGFMLHGMGAGGGSEIDGTLQKGTDSDYDALLKQLQ